MQQRDHHYSLQRFSSSTAFERVLRRTYSVIFFAHHHETLNSNSHTDYSCVFGYSSHCSHSRINGSYGSTEGDAFDSSQCSYADQIY
uniref:Uncharacterized protein n=1 Tax=Plectus sambesii TaxID=2011161 RepID=A0A914VU39_9BILA